MMAHAHRPTPGNHVTLVDRRVAFDQRDELVDATLPDFGAEARVQCQLIGGPLKRSQPPDTVGRFTVWRMHFAAPRCGIPTERCTEEISPQSTQQCGRVRREFLLRPRRD